MLQIDFIIRFDKNYTMFSHVANKKRRDLRCKNVALNKWRDEDTVEDGSILHNYIFSAY